MTGPDHGRVQLLLNGLVCVLVVLIRVVDWEGLSEKQSGIRSHLKVWSLKKPNGCQTRMKQKNTGVDADPRLCPYIQSLPENGLVEITEHLVHLGTTLPGVEVTHNLHTRAGRLENRSTLYSQFVMTADIKSTCLTLL